MKRVKRQNVKKESPEASHSQFRDEEEQDLAYYIHDRVELVHQVFSVLKYKDLKALAPECVRHISIDDLQELCTEELLGISSKRLCAILDGAEPPSDTESSSRSPSPPLETISLDSISSDEEILSQTSKKKKKHKHRCRDSGHSKSKSKKKKSKESPPEDVEKSKASRAGLTVLELLELQARARAIRAQLQQEQAAKKTSETVAPDSSHQSSDDEVEIKEEPADVVEISSEDEKPNIDKLQTEHPKSAKQTSPTKVTSPVKPTAQPEETTTVTKSTNEMVITVPQTKPTRKIKLNRNNVTVSLTNVIEKARNVALVETSKTATVVPSEAVKVAEKTLSSGVEKVKPKLKRKKKDKKAERVEEDHDEITLQLSDSEKMDLLQDLDRKALENVSSSEDSESSSESDSQSDENSCTSRSLNEDTLSSTALKNNFDNNSAPDCVESNSTKNEKVIGNVQQTSILDTNTETGHMGNVEEIMHDKNIQKCTEIKDYIQDLTQDSQSSTALEMEANTQETEPKKETLTTANLNKPVIAEIPDENCKDCSPKKKSKLTVETENKFTKQSDALKTSSCKESTEKSLEGTGNNSKNVLEISTIEDIPLIIDKSDPDKADCSSNTVKHNNNGEADIEKKTHDTTIKTREINLSEGEISDQQSSEIEMRELKQQVVCISDEERSSKKKKKKKDKKSKKGKSKKSKPVFQESADENFYKDIDNGNKNRKSADKEMLDIKVNRTEIIGIEGESIYIDDDDDIYEILEISDDSSCYEVEGTALSKEPTTDEILALSAKIDEIGREEVVTEEQVRVHNRMLEDRENNGESVENISWKDRYLGSKKVKKVLTTSNILNALRKRNKKLKKKLEDSKKKEETVPPPLETPAEEHLEEGTIEHYNMLQGSTTYVDPLKESDQKEMEAKEQLEKGAETGEQSEKPVEQNAEKGTIGGPFEQTEKSITKEMKKDAKQILKMYKRLLKYNDITKQKDPNKKKKKKKQ